MSSATSHGTGISWTHGEGYRGETWNPVTGCSKVSRECQFCYAEALSIRRGWSQAPWTPANAERNVVLRPKRLDQPLRWRAPRMIFVCSMADLFHELVPAAYIARVWAVMALAPRHVFQVLTKRPERMRDLVGDAGWPALVREMASAMAEEGALPRPDARAVADGALEEATWPLPNTWLGTSVGLRHFVSRVDRLRETPAAVRFVSAEPLIGPLAFDDVTYDPETDEDVRIWGDTSYEDALARRFRPEIDLRGIDQVIVGGESGPGHATMRIEWVWDLLRVARKAGTAFFVKQDSGLRPGQQGRIPPDLWALKELPGVRPTVPVPSGAQLSLGGS